ncbi:hypothetical protein [Nocardia farcinica]|uniref:hypothetical protein n=1 Tax=Nocardia farcinica TaxID=37329 RepID=UPI001893507B|nr:hypothetical protein [Nocardia farcinica]MBF6139645.1 hypothetical protein [Nocardia farcinica]MBF6382913.1 hypothetical protein [Nocardia farcinica]MBF6538296.1 hypothetical protein [Nocardia farcinica]
MALPRLATLVLLAGLLTECVGAAAASYHHPASTAPSPAHTAAHPLDDAAHPCAPHPAHCVEKALAPAGLPAPTGTPAAVPVAGSEPAPAPSPATATPRGPPTALPVRGGCEILTHLCIARR